MSEIILKKPVSLLNRDVKFDLKEFFIQASSTVAGTAIQVATANPIGALTSIVKGLSSTSKAISLEDVPVEQRAWLLVVTSLTHAIAKILEDFNDLFENNIEKSQLNTVSEQLTNQVNEIEITLTNEFFNNPHQLSFLNDLSPILKNWLQQLGLNDSQASSFIYQFKSQFPMSLHREWGTNPAYYAPIVEKLDTPFNTANRLQRQASEYRYWLQQQVNERMFDEAFGLKQIYVPLRAYYLESEEQTEDIIDQELIEPIEFKVNRNINKKVCDLKCEIQEWLIDYNELDTLRVISGGPGSGKSSFAKMLAADLASQSDIPVLFIPLHRFQLTSYLPEAIKQFVASHIILSNTDITEEQGLLLVFDGLDELAMQSGSNAVETSNRFITEVQDALKDRKALRWRAIVTGRELSIQSQQHRLKKSKTILFLLPYFINEYKRQNFADVDDLLINDQRNEWWQKLAKLKGLNFNSLPEELATEHLEPITTEPLLNYLVSLSYLKKDGITFSKNTNLNEVYADLLDSVHERRYTDSGIHRSVDNIDKKKFVRILQEIALTVWHENKRAASVSQITEQCKKAGINSYFKEFTKDAESGVIRLLMAFYFRKFDGNNSDETFEFTHKSFGEYLTAKRIMLELSKMLTEVERFKEESDTGWSLEDAFEKWIKVCGPQVIDSYLREFLVGEVQILASSKSGLSRINQYQELLVELIQMAVNGRSPINKLNLGTFDKDLRYSRNSEVALLELHSLCAKQTKKVIESVKFKNRSAFSDWLNVLNYRHNAKLNHLYLVNCSFSNNFSYCDFSGTVLDNSHMFFCNFIATNFKGVSLKGSDITKVIFFGVNLSDVNLLNVDFTGVSFESSTLRDLNFEKSTLIGCSFKSTKIERTSFKGFDFRKAEYFEVHIYSNPLNFDNINFSYANIKNSDFGNSNLENAKFKDSEIVNTNFEGANLKGTVLEGLYSTKKESGESS